MDKPDGLYLIRPEQGAAFVASLPVGKFYGIGPATEKKMHKLGIMTGADLKNWSELDLGKHFGKSANYYFNISRGIDHRPVRSSRVRKSLGTETTFAEDIIDNRILLEKLKPLVEKVFKALTTHQLQAKTLTLKVKYADFQQVTRACTHTEVFSDIASMLALLPNLLAKTDSGEKPVRLIGVTASHFVTEDNHTEVKQLGLI